MKAGEPADSQTYALLRCEACASAVTVAPPDSDAYESGVYAAREPGLSRLIAHLQALVLAQPARMLRRHLSAGATVLDAGAGRGRLVRVLGRAGLDARGIDPSSRGVALAQAAGVPVSAGALQQHDDSDLDAVVLWHVLEHLDEPGEALGRVRGWLEPGGLVLVGVPNLSSLQRRIAGRAWFHFDTPRHRMHFTRTGLRKLLEREGLEVIDEYHLVWQHNLHGMWFALLTRLGMTPGFPFHFAKRNVRARPKDMLLLGLGTVLLPPAVLLEAAAAAARRGGTIAVLSRVSTGRAGSARSAPG